MKLLICTLLITLPLMASASNAFTVKATKTETKIFVKPVLESPANCEEVSSAVVLTESINIPVYLPHPVSVCSPSTTQLVTRVENGQEVEVEVVVPGRCQYCQIDRNGKPYNCSRGASVVISPSKNIIRAHELELRRGALSTYTNCNIVEQKYIELPVTPGYDIVLKMPKSVKSIDVMLSLPEGELPLEDVTFQN